MSEIICLQCKKGSLVYPLGEKKLKLPWKCKQCPYEIEAVKVKDLIEKSQNDLK